MDLPLSNGSVRAQVSLRARGVRPESHAWAWRAKGYNTLFCTELRWGLLHEGRLGTVQYSRCPVPCPLCDVLLLLEVGVYWECACASAQSHCSSLQHLLVPGFLCSHSHDSDILHPPPHPACGVHHKGQLPKLGPNIPS